MSNTRTIIGSISVDRVTQSAALDAISSLVAARRGGYVVTPNVDHIVQAARNPELRPAYRTASLSLADGMPLVWMSRLLGEPLPEKVSGSDLILPLMERAALEGWRVFLFGASPAVSADAARRLLERYPRLNIVGRNTTFWSPDAPASDERFTAVGEIRHANSDLVVLALGAPKQELWMHRHAEAIRPAVAIGMGASLDFVAGSVRRAPSWMANAGLEWLFRLAQEPRRLAYRYLVCDLMIVPIFAASLGRRAWKLRPLKAAAAGVPKRDSGRPAMRQVEQVGPAQSALTGNTAAIAGGGR